MSDLMNTLASYITDAQGSLLWILDEHPMESISTQVSHSALTNRYDVACRLKENGWAAHFSDFDFAPFEHQTFDTIVYRISKERGVCHHVINQASRLLSAQGTFVLIGHKQEGIKSYIKAAKQRFNHIDSQEKLSGDLWVGLFSAVEPLGLDLNDKDYPILRNNVLKTFPDVFSKPGIYGWDKVDKGSELLVESVRQWAQDKPPIQSLLDIGCGYGFLSIQLSELCSQLTATDNNAGAINACSKNLEHLPNATVVPGDAGNTLTGTYDLIVCNPPFHSGFETSNDLTTKFLQAAARHMTPEATALFVTNLHVPLKQKAHGYFKSVEEVTVTPHFRVTSLTKALKN